jgi:hypothetical protein
MFNLDGHPTARLGLFDDLMGTMMLKEFKIPECKLYILGFVIYF